MSNNNEVVRIPIKEVNQIPVKEYEKPRVGPHSAIYSHTEDLGEKNYGFGLKPYLYACLELTDQKQSDGKPFLVKQLCTQSLHPRPASKLFEIVSELLGYDPPRNFDLAKLKGTRCTLEIVYAEKDDGAVYANIRKIRRLETEANIASKERVAKGRNHAKNQARVHDAIVADATAFLVPDEDPAA